MEVATYNQRRTQKAKDANEQQYYKEQLDLLDSRGFSRNNFFNDGRINDIRRKKVNYELFNNVLNLKDFSYVCQPFGAEIGELPAQMANRDIISGKIKALLGMEANRSFTWKVAAINEEATTRKEQETFGRMRDFVISSIMQPIAQNIEMQYQEQLNGKKLSPDQQKQVQDQIQSELSAKTPEEVMKYMAREHQDPAEVLAKQLMKYLMQKETITDKFLKGFKHGCISGEEVYWIGIVNGEPVVRVINSLYFDHAKSPDSEMIEDSEWGMVELRMTVTEVVGQFGSELGDKDIDDLYEQYPIGSPSQVYSNEDDFSFEEGRYDNTIRVLYAEWKSQRKIGFLSVINEQGELDTIIVNEDYKLNTNNGDVEIDWQWIPEVHHGYKIGADLYVGLGPIPGQHKDLDNLYDCKLRFVGVSYDNMNAETTSLVDRMKAYQYYYNIIMYRIELLMASDRGKILMMNINAIPTSAGIDIQKFHYFMEANKIAFYNPNEEGNKGGSADAGSVAKEIDMSLVSDIAKYIQFAEYIEKRCGDSVGINANVEGQTSPNEAVRNAQSNLTQSINILEPYFQLHNNIKRNVLQRLIETAKVAYTESKPKKLSYVLDDMSMALLDLNSDNQELLDNSTYGIFVGDSAADTRAKQAVEQLAHAAMQTQQVDLLDVVKVLRSDDIQEAEELLEVGTQKAQQIQAQNQQKQMQMQQENAQMEREHEQEMWAHEKDMVMLKAEQDRETKVQVATISAMGYDLNKDEDQDGEPDVLEVAKHGIEANIKLRKMALEERQADITNKQTDKKLELEDKKIQAMKAKKVKA